MPGYSGTPLAKKLGIKPGSTLLLDGAPADYPADNATVARSLSEQLQAEAVSFSECSATADFVEGITAFLAKRAPQFGRE